MDPATSSITIPLAVLAGVVSFASPCFLPIVPVYVGYLVGEDADHRTKTALTQAFCFVGGFTTVFVALWASIGLVGYAMGDYKDLLRVVGGVLLIVMGLHVAKLIEISTLYRQVRLPVGPRVGAVDAHPHPSPRRSALLGVAFAAGWTPCIGPVLGGVIGLASTRDSLGQGAVLLLAYALGLGIPFVLVAVGMDRISAHLRWLQRHDVAVSTVSGAALVLIGFLMITDTFTRLAALAPALGI